MVCVLWNSASFVFARMAVHSFQRGETDWWLIDFRRPLLAGGHIWAGDCLCAACWITANVGPTLVEISAHPLVPGAAYEIYSRRQGEWP